MEKYSSGYPVSSAYFEAEFGMPESVRNYVNQLRQQVGTPDMTDGWGCTTAAAAFTHNLLLPSAVTPADVDRIVGREPNHPGNAQEINLWYLRQGLKLETYETEFSNRWMQPYLHDSISPQQFIQAYEHEFGHAKAARYRENLPYIEEVAKPAYLAAQAQAQPYLNNGQLSVGNGHPSPELLVELINQGKLVQVSQLTDTAIAHRLVIFRPRADRPGIYFDPVLPLAADEHSDIFALSTFTLDTIDYDSTFVAISQR